MFYFGEIFYKCVPKERIWLSSYHSEEVGVRVECREEMYFIQIIYRLQCEMCLLKGM